MVPLAADQGEPRAQLNLGRMYEKGQGVPQDFILAHMMYNLAAAQESGNDNYPGMRRKSLEERMTPAQIAEAQKLAREWKPTPTPARSPYSLGIIDPESSNGSL